jgi:hypothetical protein
MVVRHFLYILKIQLDPASGLGKITRHAFKEKAEEIFIQYTMLSVLEYLYVNAQNILKYFPIYGPDSTPAAMAAQCVNDQGKFRNYYDILFKNQGPQEVCFSNTGNRYTKVQFLF